MRSPLLLDTGPLVAYLDPEEQYHEWAVAQWAQPEAPFLTCEAVLTEACFLIARAQGFGGAVVELVCGGALQVPFRLDNQAKAITQLMGRYANVPMSFADACLVRMAEQYPDSVVLTLDRHFKLYRKHGRQVIPSIMPAAK